MKRENKTKYAILGVLMSTPQTGYDIRKFLTQAGGFWEESNGQIYPMLKKLLDEGLVEKSIVFQEAKPNRHVYTITEQGKETLRTWLQLDVAPSRTRNELLLKLFFGDEAPVTVNQQHVADYKNRLEQNLAEYATIEKRLQQLPDTNSKKYWLMTLRHGQAYTSGLIAWCNDTLHQLHEMVDEHPQAK